MDSEQEKFLVSLGKNTSSIFSEFMWRIAKFEELVHMAYQLLAGFRQELETFRKPQIYKTSDLVDHIIEANHTERMKAYVEAGSRHHYNDIQNIIKLHSCRQGLEDHLRKGKKLLDELKFLKEGATGIALSADHHALLLLDKSIDVSKGHTRFDIEEEETIESAYLQDKSVSHAILMTVIYNMLSLDYAMQENIINSINFASMDQLESYCLMWDLRPYVNNNIMHQSWALVC